MSQETNLTNNSSKILIRRCEIFSQKISQSPKLHYQTEQAKIKIPPLQLAINNQQHTINNLQQQLEKILSSHYDNISRTSSKTSQLDQLNDKLSQLLTSKTYEYHANQSSYPAPFQSDQRSPTQQKNIQIVNSRSYQNIFKPVGKKIIDFKRFELLRTADKFDPLNTSCQNERSRDQTIQTEQFSQELLEMKQILKKVQEKTISSDFLKQYTISQIVQYGLTSCLNLIANQNVREILILIILLIEQYFKLQLNSTTQQKLFERFGLDITEIQHLPIQEILYQILDSQGGSSSQTSNWQQQNNDLHIAQTESQQTELSYEIFKQKILIEKLQKENAQLKLEASNSKICSIELQQCQINSQQLLDKLQRYEKQLQEFQNNQYYFQDIKKLQEDYSKEIKKMQNLSVYYMRKNQDLEKYFNEFKLKSLCSYQETHTPRPSLDGYVKLINYIEQSGNFGLDSGQSTVQKLELCLEKLDFYFSNQKKTEQQIKVKSCQYCTKIENLSQDKIIFELRGENLSGSASNQYQIEFKLKSQGQWYSLGNTELVTGTSPKFEKTIQVDYVFEEKQVCQFLLKDSKKPIFNVQISIGFIINKLVNNVYTLHLTDQNRQLGTVFIKCKPAQKQSDIYFMQWSAIDLYNVEENPLEDKSDPYLIFYNIDKIKKTQTSVHKTEIIMDNQEPEWRKFSLKADVLCDSDIQKPILIKCLDWNQDDDCRLIGECQVTMNEIKSGKNKFKIGTLNKPSTGYLILKQLSIQKADFLDFIFNGIQLNLILAIDYTKSNGDHTNNSSLHFIDPAGNFYNQYQRVIMSLGDLLLDYDNDGEVPCYGFGAIPKFEKIKSETVNHCFPITGDPEKISITGLDNIMQAYINSLSQLEFSQPTLFDPIIQEAIELASLCNQNNNTQKNYQVLVIMTDGEIHDMKRVLESISQASKLPISIIIIGIGSANFTKMYMLDCYNSNNRNTSNQSLKKIPRDMVQFVQFSQVSQDPVQFTKVILKNLPTEISQYSEQHHTNF